MPTLPTNINEGYSPVQIDALWTVPWDERFSPVRLKKDLSEEVLLKVPFLNMTLHLLRELESKREIKLTAIGNLPLALCKELYSLCPFNEIIESGISKIRSENDVIEVIMLHTIAKELGWVKHRLGKISLTAKGKKILSTPREILRQLLIVFCSWGICNCFDRYEYGNLNCGAAFLFILLHKYGNEVHNLRFYTEKYLLACYELHWIEPYEVDAFTQSLNSPIFTRLFRRFMIYFGVLTIKKDKFAFLSHYEKTEIKATPLLYELIDVDSPINKKTTKTDIRFS